MRNKGFLILLLFVVIIINIALAQSYSYSVGIRNFRSSKALLEKNITFKELFNNLDELVISSFSTVAMEKGMRTEKLGLLLDDDIVIFGKMVLRFDFHQFLSNPAEYIFGILEMLSKEKETFALIFKCQSRDDAKTQRGILMKLLNGSYNPIEFNEFVFITNRNNDKSNVKEYIQRSNVILRKLDDNIFAYGELKFGDQIATLYGKVINDMVIFKIEREIDKQYHYFSELLNLPVLFGYSVVMDPRDKKTMERELDRFGIKRDILNLIEDFSDLIGRVLISVDIKDEDEKRVILFLKGDGKEIMKKVTKGIPGLFVKNNHGVKLYSYLGEWDIAFGNWYMIATKNVDPVSVAIRVETGNKYDSNHIYYNFRRFGVETPFFEKIIDLNDVFDDLLNQNVKHTLFYQRGIYSNKLIDILFIK